MAMLNNQRVIMMIYDDLLVMESQWVLYNFRVFRDLNASQDGITLILVACTCVLKNTTGMVYHTLIWVDHWASARS